MGQGCATLMVQGTTSDAGKSTLVTALCRWLARQGVRVAPFKPQNMALNSAVTADGGEIGRAQAVQAQAARLGAAHRHEPGAAQAQHRHRRAGHHPRPRRRQHGRARPTTTTSRVGDARRCWNRYAAARRRSTTASSSKAPAARPRSICATNDIANMGFAEAVDCPVILIADIDRGGVFAHLVGTLALLSAERAGARQGLRHQPLSRRHRAAATGPRLAGARDRQAGARRAALSARPAPRRRGCHRQRAQRPGRDGAAARAGAGAAAHQQPHRFRSAAPASRRWTCASSAPGEALPPADLIILPGSKTVRADLAWLRAQGWDAAIDRHLRYGGKLIGICGGFQMLGRAIARSARASKARRAAAPGSACSTCETTLAPEQAAAQCRGHAGRRRDAGVAATKSMPASASGPALAQPAVLARRAGPTARCRTTARSSAPICTACSTPRPRPTRCWRWAGLRGAASPDIAALRDAAIDRLADAVEAHLDTRALRGLLGGGAMLTQRDCWTAMLTLILGGARSGKSRLARNGAGDRQARFLHRHRPGARRRNGCPHRAPPGRAPGALEHDRGAARSCRRDPRGRRRAASSSIASRCG